MNSEKIDIKRLYEGEAFEFYSECPKIITVVRHADKTDDSEFHCIWNGLHFDKETKEVRSYSSKKSFIVPGQKVRQFLDPLYGDYLAVKVMPLFGISLYEGEMFWLFVSVKNPCGFLTPIDTTDITKYVLEEPPSGEVSGNSFPSMSWVLPGIPELT